MTPEGPGNPWRTVSSRQVCENPWIWRARIRSYVRTAEPGIYGVVHYKNVAVGILAIEEDHVYLVGQYRYPLEMYSWEIPEGGCPDGEGPSGAARRELREETGLEATSWRKLGEAFLSNSVADEYAVWFLATGLVPGEVQPEGTENPGPPRAAARGAGHGARRGITGALSIVALTSYALNHKGSTGREGARAQRGVGGAKLAAGLESALSPGDHLAVVVNTADDFDLWGLRICPDLDTVMYTLAGVANPRPAGAS